MKGKAIIELTDKNGKKTTHEHNMTTDVFKDVFTVVSNLSGGGTSSDIIRHYGSYMANLFKGFRDTNMYGIKLYENKNAENCVVFPHQAAAISPATHKIPAETNPTSKQNTALFNLDKHMLCFPFYSKNSII